MQNKSKRLAGLITALVLLSAPMTEKVWAQGAGTIKGSVTDASASVMPNVTVQITGNGSARTATTDATGKFTVAVPPGSYAVKASAKGFVTFSQAQLAVAAGQVSPLDITLQIAAEVQEVNVSDSAAGQVSVDPSSNVGALVLKNEDLDALPDDPDDLQADLQALAGPSAGPNGAQFFVDGFSGGQLPPKSSIREIRINSNPFAAEFDAPGFGRIEILTKPGSDNYHGAVSMTYGDRVLDTRNPFIATEPGYSTKSFMGNFGGPITKKSSFSLNFNRRQIDEDALINAQTLNSAFAEVPYIGAYATPNRLLQLTGRLDYQLNATNTLVMRYTHTQSSNVGGVGGFNLPTQQTNTTGKINEIQITETAIIGTKAVDETRFQFRDNHSATTAAFETANPGINVSGAFSSGGPPQTSPDYTFTKGFELQNFITISQGAHAIKIGGRARESSITDFSTADFNGSYNFSLSGGVIPACLSSLAGGGYTPTSLDLYKQTQLELSQGIPIATIEAQGCGPTQFTLAAGQPLLHVTQEDLGMFAQDDWRAKPNLTVSGGIRYETQNNIHDHNDWAPRIGIAWAPFAKKNAPSKTVIRAGYGWFYSRVPIGDAENALRNNGFTQQNYQLTSSTIPLSSYPNLPTSAALGGATLLQQNIDVIDRNIKASLLMQTAIGVERSLPGRTTVSFNYINSRGVHVARTRDINAPLPGPYAAGLTVLPYPGIGPIYLNEDSGLFKQSQYQTNVSTRFNRRFSMNGYYVLGFAHTNAQGLPMEQYNESLDWGRASYDKRHSGYIGGTINLPYAINVAPFVTLSSGGPFNITTGAAYEGDGIFNLRPAFATAPGPNSKIVTTKYGTFDLNPTTGEAFIPINYGNGPNTISANVRISRTWGWGEKVAANPNAAAGGDPGAPGGGGAPRGGGGGGGRGGGGMAGGGFGGGGRGGGGGAPRGGGGGASGKKYSLTATVNARNFINHVNLGNPTGLVTSPFFGQSTALAGGGGGGFGGGGSAAGVRRIEFSLRLSF